MSPKVRMIVADQEICPTLEEEVFHDIIEDNVGAIIKVPSVPISGGPRRETMSLEPGQIANWEIEPLIINRATDKSKRILGNRVNLEPGKYLLWYRLGFYGRSLVVTGKRELVMH